MTQIPVQQAISAAIQHHRAGRSSEAEAIYREVLAGLPDHADALHLLGILLQERGEHRAAIELIARSLAIAQSAECQNNLARSLHALGDVAGAERAWSRSVEQNPNLAAAWANFGVLLAELGRVEEAEKCYRRALAISPNDSRALTGVGEGLHTRGFLCQACRWYENALVIDPRFSRARRSLGAALLARGNIDEAIAQYQIITQGDPGNATAQSDLLLAMNYDARRTAADVCDAHKKWGSAVEQTISPSAGRANPCHEKLRIGYVSADFRRHSVIFFLEALLAHHDRSRFEIFCYNDASPAAADDFTQRAKSYADTWRNVHPLSNDQLAGQIGADEIDILVDLTGHAGANRLLAFAQKPAPVQMSYLGYANTTGLSRIDYRITDPIADPPGESESLHTEALLRLNRCAWCYQPLANSPEPNDPPAIANGYITFGSFNNIAKINTPTAQAWAEVLSHVPSARLIVKSPNLIDPQLQIEFRGRLAKAGVDITRVELLGVTPDPAGHLAAYHRVDIALDTFHYNGTTTTCDALWMGVPVITLAGDRHAARVGASLLSVVGLSEFAANGAAEYVELARRLAADMPRLTELRAGLRTRMRQSDLCNGAGLAQAIEGAYRQSWREWCERRG